MGSNLPQTLVLVVHGRGRLTASTWTIAAVVIVPVGTAVVRVTAALAIAAVVALVAVLAAERRHVDPPRVTRELHPLIVRQAVRRHH